MQSLLNTALEVVQSTGMPIVEMSGTKLDQVLINLILNARDAMPDGGRIEVKTETDDRLVRICVTDDGIGIPFDVQSKMFNAYFTTKTANRGYGLALSIVKSIIADANGTIEAESTPDVGTRFTVTLPIFQPM